MCVDGSDFHSKKAADIGTTIETYLGQCDGLLVLASKNARASTWVGEEVRWFLEHRPDAIRVALTEGGDPARAEEVLPQPLVDAGFHRRIAYDFRGAKRGHQQWRAVRDFEDERTRLAADLYGRPAGEISPIWFREQRRRSVNQLRASIAVAAVLLALLGVALYFFFTARAEARRAWRQSFISGTNLALRAWRDGSIDLARQTLDALVATEGQEDHRDFEWSHVHRRVTAERRRLFVEKMAFTTVDVSADGALLAGAGGLRGEVKEGGENPAHHVYVWSLPDGKPRFTLKGHSEEISSVAFSPTAPLLASSDEESVRIWDLRTGRLVHTIDLGASQLRFLPQGDGLVTLDFDRVAVFETQGWTERGSASVGGEAFTRALGTDGREIAVGVGQRAVFLDARTLKVLRTLDFEAEVGAIAFSPRNLVAIAAGSSIGLYRGGIALDPGLVSDETVGSLAFSRDGAILAIGAGDWQDLAGGRVIHLWDVARNGDRGELRGPPGRVFSMAMTPDGALVAAGEDETLRVWDLDRGSFLQGLRFNSTTPMWSLAFTRDPRTLIAAGGNGRVFFAPLDSSKPITALAAHTTRFDLAVATNGMIATAGADSVFVRQSRDAPSRLLVRAPNTLMTSLAFSPDDRVLAAGDCSGTIRFWDAPDFPTMTTRTQKACAAFLAWSPDSRLIASGGGDPANESSPKSVVIRDPKRSEPVAVLDGHQSWPHAAAFSPDGKLLVTGDWRGELIVWDTKRWKQKSVLRGHGDLVVGVLFSPSGKTILSASQDGTVRVWDGVTGQERAVLNDAGGQLFSLAMSADGSMIAASKETGEVILWLAEGATISRSRGVPASPAPSD